VARPKREGRAVGRSGPSSEVLFGPTWARPSRYGQIRLERGGGEAVLVGIRDGQLRPSRAARPLSAN
jgi:hypothetical protein